jgi:hypothetical protein
MKKSVLFLIVIFAFIFAKSLKATVYTANAATVNWSAVVWSPAGTPGAADDVIIPDGATVTIDVNFEINNLTIGGGTTGILRFSQTYGATLIVHGNILIQPGAQFIVRTNSLGVSPNGGLLHTLTLEGNFTHLGSSLIFRTGTAGSTLSGCNLTLSGITNSTLTVTGTFTTGNGFNAVTINKIGGAKVILGSNIIISGGSSAAPAILNSTLTFVSGIVETGNFILICQTTTTAQVTGYSSASYVIGAMGRGMSSTAGSNKDFPVGDANSFEIFNLRSTTSGSATGNYAVVRCVPGNANTGSSVLNGGIDRVSSVRYYQVSYNNVGTGAASMSFDRFDPSYNSDDGVVNGNTFLRAAYSTDNGSTWNGITQYNLDTVNTTTLPNILTVDSIAPVLTLNAGSGSILVSLADTAKGSNPLPVELTSFTATSNNNNVNLKWSSATELRNSGFYIERKFVSNTSSWEKIGFVKGAGNSNTVTNYLFTDNNSFVSGKYQYRLKQVDINGSYSYSGIVEINISLPKEYSLSQNYPNPFNPSTVIEYSVPKSGNVEIKVFNTIGEEVTLIMNEYKEAGNYSVNFNAAALSSGIYFYQLKSGNFSSIKKMILIK